MSQGPSILQGIGSQFQEPSKDMETQSNPSTNPASEEDSGEDDVEETRLMETEGGLSKP